MGTRNIFLGTIATIALMHPLSGMAQPLATGGGEPSRTQAPAATGLETTGEILVTAQRRSERLQDVPVTVSAFGGAKLATSGVTSITDIGQLVPSLSVSSAIGYTTTYLRGVGTGSGAPGIEPPVAIYVDGVYYASSMSSLINLASVDRLEVLKGPQGTLFGRNATGGLIQVFTSDPTQQFKASGHIGFANYDTFSGDAYVSGGVASNLAADFLVEASGAGKGYGTNVGTGDDVNRNYHDVTIRSKWIWTPGVDTKITAIGDYSNKRTSQIAARILQGVANPDLNDPGEPKSPWDGNYDIDPLLTNQNYGVSLKIEQDLGFATLSNLAAYRRSTSTDLFDIDLTRTPGLNIYLDIHEWQISDELQLSSHNSGKLKWTTGLFFFKASGTFEPSEANFFLGQAGPFTKIDTNDRTGTLSVSGYAQGSYEFLPATNLTLGARYTWERRDLVGTDTGFLPDGSSELLTIYPKTHIIFRKPTFRSSVDHRFSPSVLVYASFNTGFKSGGYNAGSPADAPFKPETLTSFEGGLKTDFFHRRLRLNVDAFHYSYKNIQVQKTNLASTGIINGASAEMWGVESDFDAAITSQFHLSGSAAYLHTRYTSFPNAPSRTSPDGYEPLVNEDASGNELLKAPHFQANLTAEYDINLSSGQTLRFAGSGEYNSGYFLTVDNIVRQKSFARTNASVALTSANKHSDIKLWVSNITNRAVIGYGNEEPDGTQYGNYEPPRTYGVTFGFKY